MCILPCCPLHRKLARGDLRHDAFLRQPTASPGFTTPGGEGACYSVVAFVSFPFLLYLTLAKVWDKFLMITPNSSTLFRGIEDERLFKLLLCIPLAMSSLQILCNDPLSARNIGISKRWNALITCSKCNKEPDSHRRISFWNFPRRLSNVSGAINTVPWVYSDSFLPTPPYIYLFVSFSYKKNYLCTYFL